MNEFINKWYQQPIFESLIDHPNFPDLVQSRSKNDPKTVALSLTGMSQGRQTSLWPHLSKVKIPTLLIAGEKDKKYVSLMERMNRQIKNSRFIKIKNAGHNVHFENPQEYIKELQLFLRRSKNGKY
jgi:2-succinyl-6-hydroxy-2,4-cyclohexadiene-1-carboxylate synthase